MLLNMETLQGNEEVKKQLIHMVDSQAIGHALLFVGPEGVGKSLFAMALVQMMLSRESAKQSHLSKLESGSHPDVHHYYPEGKLGMHPIQSLRQLAEEVNLPPFESEWKFFIIHDADRMLTYSANALLKTFEEPPPRTLIILISPSVSSLMPTIISRCRTVRFQSLQQSSIEQFLENRYPDLDASIKKAIANQAQGSFGKAMRLAHQKGDPYRQLILSFLAHGKVNSFKTLQEVAHQLQLRVDEVRKEAEEVAKKEANRISVDQLNLQQQQALEKEIEGLTALAQLQEAQTVFEHLLSWYRDLNYLLIGGKETGLVNLDYQNSLEKAIQQGDFHPLEFVYQAVDEAYASLQRSTNLSICMETLLLKLSRVIN